MKQSILSLALLLSACGASPAMASMNDLYNSPECVFTMEADEPEVRAFAIETIVPHIDENRAMTFEDYSFKDTLVAIQMVVCEGKTPQEAVNFVDPD